ncbi:MAG: retropepsin-like aspartic protease [Bacteroidota bacterium]
MKVFTLFVLLLALCMISQAQKFTYNQGTATTKNYYAEIPYENVSGKLFVDVEIGGKKHKFLLDTGAPTSLSKEIVDEAKLAVIQKTSVMDVSGQVDTINVVTSGEIRIGNVGFANIPALAMIPEWYHCWGVDGVIGSNLLRNSIISFDDKKHLMILTDQLGKLPFLNNKNSAKLTTNTDIQSTPTVKFTLKNNVNLALEFDTGDNVMMRLTTFVMDQLIKMGVCDILQKGFGANNYGLHGLQKSAEKFMVNIPFLTIANTRFDHVTTTVNSTGIPGLGTRLLDYGIVTLDYIHGKFYLNADNPAYDLTARQWPFQATFASDKLIVGLVYEKAAEQVKIGQQILAIDGIDYTKVTFCNWTTIKPMLEAKETALFTIKDEQGDIKKLQLSKQ